MSGYGLLIGLVLVGVMVSYVLHTLAAIEKNTATIQKETWEALRGIHDLLERIESHTEATSGNTWRVTPEGHEHHQQIDDARF